MPGKMEFVWETSQEVETKTTSRENPLGVRR